MKHRILVVDADRAIRESLRRILRAEDYEVILAADGQEALDRFILGGFDLMLLDLDLPVRDGWEIFERITGENPLMPVIILSAEALPEPVVGATVGAVMQKPFEIARLLETVRKLLAEPMEERLCRMCGSTQDTQGLAADSAAFVRRLRARLSERRPSNILEMSVSPFEILKHSGHG